MATKYTKREVLIRAVVRIWIGVSAAILVVRLIQGWLLERDIWIADRVSVAATISALNSVVVLLRLPPSSAIGSGVRAAMGALLGSDASLDRALVVDFERELRRNKPMAAASPDKQVEHRSALRATLVGRLAILRTTLITSFASMASAVLVGLLVAPQLDVALTRSLSILSVFCFAWATLGRLGWKGRSYSGDTSIEKLDRLILHVLYWFGMFLATLALG
jgi:hypothetical protein